MFHEELRHVGKTPVALCMLMSRDQGGQNDFAEVKCVLPWVKVILPWWNWLCHEVSPFHICKWCLIYMIQKAYKYVSSSLWPCLTFSSWKSLTYWNQVGGDWKRVSYHENGIFYSHKCVSCRTISLPSFNVLHCKLARITLFIYSNIIIESSVWRHQSSHLHILLNVQT